MQCRDYQEAIQDLADGRLGPVRRAELQTHLDVCDDCRLLADDLQKIRTAAPSLGTVPPPDHLWLQIAGRLRQEGRVADAPLPRSRKVALLAMAAALLLAVGGALYVLVPLQRPEPRAVTAGTAVPPAAGDTPDGRGGNAAATDAVQSIVNDFAAAEKLLQSAVTKLEDSARGEDDAFDPETAQILTKNLQIIDQAIAESRAALQAEPQSAIARDSLFEALRRKVTLLQDTIALMNEMRKGNSAGAGQLLDGGKS